MKTYNIVSIDEFKTNIQRNSRLLGIDHGNKNIGFAICDENKKVATPLKILQKSTSKIGTSIFGSIIGASAGICSCGPIGFALISTFGAAAGTATAF